MGTFHVATDQAKQTFLPRDKATAKWRQELTLAARPNPDIHTTLRSHP
jgi:phosphopantothenoylcysteine synthetase/decarboxylase